MKYILMMIMFLSSIAICLIVNRGKEERIEILKQLKQSVKSFDVYEYFSSFDTSQNKYFPMLKNFVEDVKEKRMKTKEAKEEMVKKMGQVLFEKSDSSMLLRWLGLIKNPKDSIKRDEVEKQCNLLIERTKSEEKSNIYIALAVGVVLLIIVI